MTEIKIEEILPDDEPDNEPNNETEEQEEREKCAACDEYYPTEHLSSSTGRCQDCQVICTQCESEADPNDYIYVEKYDETFCGMECLKRNLEEWLIKNNTGCVKCDKTAIYRNPDYDDETFCSTSCAAKYYMEK